jgi:transposase InsO family protein
MSAWLLDKCIAYAKAHRHPELTEQTIWECQLDAIYGAAVTRRLRAMGIRDKPIAPGSPWQNAFAERLIGSIRRECVDHMVVLGEAHLRRMLQSYARYYNEIRTHRSLNKDAPLTRPVQRSGHIVSHAMVGGLHHQYVRI